MPRKIPSLSNTEIGRIRSNLSRSNTQIGNRLRECAMGTLKDKQGNLITMTSAELKAAELLFKNTLPAQAASTIEDVTPDYMLTDPKQVQEQMNDMLNQMLDALSVDELSAVIESKGIDKLS